MSMRCLALRRGDDLLLSEESSYVYIAVCADVKEVLLSDGNEKAIESILLVLSNLRVFEVVRWDSERDVAAMEGRFDVVMCADCLFLDQYRACLVDALRRLLRPDGTALVFAPTRGDTLTEFCRLAERAGLLVCRYDNYDSIIWDLHIKMKREGKEAYDENIHYPVLLTLTHIPSPHLL
ncbi:calmodulin-lysine N-methyltransferase [Silurus meridionalis]|nr:calmodulin-lysine N-methyltransferase [Silurus meridionalis]